MYQLYQVFSDSLEEMTETLKSTEDNNIRDLLVLLINPETIQFTPEYFAIVLAVQTEYYRRTPYISRLDLLPPENIRI